MDTRRDINTQATSKLKLSDIMMDSTLESMTGDVMDTSEKTDGDNCKEKSNLDFKDLTESEQNVYAESSVFDNKGTCDPVKRENLPPQTEDNEQHGEEKSISKPDGQTDMSKSNKLPDSNTPVSSTNLSLTIVLFGNSSSVQLGDENILLGKKLEISRIVNLQRMISEHHVSVINMIDLHEEDDHVENLIGQLVNENEIHAFIFVVRLGQFTDADKMGLEWLQRVFGDKVLQFVMILFTYEREECDTISDGLIKNPVLDLLLEKCGGRFHTCNKMMNNPSKMRDLMDKIERLFHENQQQPYTGDMFNKILRERENLQNSGRESKNEPTINRETREPTKTTETIEKHRVTPEEIRSNKLNISTKINKSLQHRLHLDKLQHKLRPIDVLQITALSLQSHETCAEEELVQTFLQNLLMMNYRARCIKTMEIENHTEQGSCNEDEESDDVFELMNLSNKQANKPEPVHPMDVQMAVFHCADDFLKQLMVTKLSQCQYAVPLLVPNPDKQQIEFPLWTFRQINKSWKIRSQSQTISQTQLIYKAQTPMVFFFRFGSVSSSKSHLMNRLINERHDTFFHRNCTGSSRTRELMDGVVEIAWFCPSGTNNDTFTDCVAFCNLHGDAGDHEKQLQILTKISSINVVLLPRLDRNDRSAAKIQSLHKDRKPLIFLFTEDDSVLTLIKNGIYKIGLKGRNQSEVSENLIKAINDCLKESSTFRLGDVLKHSDIRVDEEVDDDCRRGRGVAQQMMSLLKEKHLTVVKESFLPHQGKLWHQWSQKNKEQHRPRADQTEKDISQKHSEMNKIRQQQHESNISEFMKLFINELSSDAKHENLFFLKWLGILLDEHTSAGLSDLHHKYDEKWSAVAKLKENNDTPEQLKSEQAELERIFKDLQAATFGLEHIMREISQIYESCSSVKKNKKDLQVDYSSLPSLAAEMMISGFPLELMDGDAAHVPVIWISAVLDQLVQKLGNQRVFVLSVLGIQSSGKSTMLNAMFGLQFPVSAGRCTRGAFMQLVKVSDKMKTMNFDYILVVDTEGLRSLELAGRLTRDHDNELATFVIGLGNMTLINIFGENPSEMHEILQIVVQATLRMKKVRLNPSCVFVHQNVSDITAGEKNKEGRRRLEETLDEMTKLAAIAEDCDEERFRDVIAFDIENDVKYFSQLWEGSPPMAPPNPKYCENIQELKRTIMSHGGKSHGMVLTDLKNRINDLWEALMNEQFVFSFRNSLEISVYRKLETEYSKWSWSLRSAMLEIDNKFHNKIENENKNEVEETKLKEELKKTTEEVEKSMSEFFETDTDKNILINWKSSFEIKIKELQETIVRETMRKLNNIIEQRGLKKMIDDQKTCHDNTLYETSKELASKLKDKETDEETLKKEFDMFWEQSVKNTGTGSSQINENDSVLPDVINILRETYGRASVDQRNQNNDVFSVSSFSEYVKLKKSSGFLKNAYRSAKEFLGYVLSNEDEVKIRSLVTDVAEQTSNMIKSFNISKMGYNISYIQQLTGYITKRLEGHQDGQDKYVFKKQFFIDLILSIFGKSNKMITDQHRLFREANDPVIYLKKKREEYYSIFQKYCHGAKSAAIFGEIICQKLQKPIEQSVYKKTARDLTDEIKKNCESLKGNRSTLEKHILKTLAKGEDFLKYMNYIHYPKDHLKSFIRDEVSRYITDHFSNSVLPKMKENIELLQQKIVKAAHESTECVQEKRGDAGLWLKSFTQQLSDVLIFSEKDLSGVKHDDVDDFNLLEDVIREKLHITISDISKENFNDFQSKLDDKDRPEGFLISHFCQCCWVQCPFCKAICTNTVENHDGDHSVAFHRCIGLNGWYFTGTTNLNIDICTSLVAGNRYFYPSESDEKAFLWKEYRKAGGDYAKWRITPDVSELPYWKWFVCRFQKDLEKHYNKTFQGEGEIPKDWRKFTKEEAIASLEESYQPPRPSFFQRIKKFFGF